MEICQLYTYNDAEYSIEKGSEEHFVSAFRTNALKADYIHWLNFHSIDKKDLIQQFFQDNAVDHLIYEDIYDPLRRPKLEEYENYLFFSIRSVVPPKVQGALLEEEQLSFILGDGYLISFQEKFADHFSNVRDRLENKKGRIRSKGADFLLYRLLDALMDNYYDVVDYLNERSRELEPQIIKGNSNDLLSIVERRKRRLQELRKIVVPLKEIATQLEKAESSIVSQENKHYFNDLKESCLGVMDEVDSTLGLLDSLTNLYYAAQGQRMNEIMKVLTVVSAIFIPLTFLAGIYGMNFVNIPELQAPNGYFILLGAMLIIGMLLVVYFYRKGWLRKN
ncbi:MAG: magnesium/cobalt transporter CorA [Fluviicola sp.]